MADSEELKDQLEELFSQIEIPEATEEEPQPVDEAKVEPAPAEPTEVTKAPESPDEPAPAQVRLTPEQLREKADQVQELERKIGLLQEANYQLQKRAIHLEASTTISQAAASILDPQELMQTTVDLIRDQFNFYHVSFFLLDEAGEWAVVRASTGEVGKQMVSQPHRLAVGGESMVGWACAHRQPRIALDVGADAVHFDNPLLPHTRSEMALPLQVGDRLLGALNVQSIEEAAFDNDDIRSLQGMADLVAIALENARLFTETQRGTQHQELVTDITERTQRATSLAEILTSTLEKLGNAFDLAEATICLGTETELGMNVNGRLYNETE